jgi:hypothetical protein
MATNSQAVADALAANMAAEKQRIQTGNPWYSSGVAIQGMKMPKTDDPQMTLGKLWQLFLPRIS